MQSLSFLVDNILGQFGETFNLNLKLKKNWESIVGSDISEITIPLDARFINQNKVKVVINVLNSALLYVNGNKDFIENSIKQYLNIQRVAIVLKQCLNISKTNIESTNNGDMKDAA